MRSAAKLSFIAAWALASALSWQQLSKPINWSPIVWPTIFTSSSDESLYQEQLIPNAGQKSTHSVSTTLLPSGDLIAFWFGGSREGGKDVQIFQSYFQQTERAWSEPLGILNVSQLGETLGRYIGKIGNPLVHVDKEKRMWLFFVTVSYGGWAGSSLNVMHSEDMGQSWGQPKRLVTSPFINVSTLVRNTMYDMDDGSLILPVYHEFAGQFPEFLHISSAGEVLEKIRMYGHGGGIQPSLVQGDGDNVLYAFMRSGSHTEEWKVLRLKSSDGGKSWQDFTVTELPNPNSAQIVARVDKDLWIWIGNHNPEHRQDLTLAISRNPEGKWQIIHHFEQGGNGEAYSYPAITQDKGGLWNLMYTANRKHIKHVQFNRAWLDKMITSINDKAALAEIGVAMGSGR